MARILDGVLGESEERTAAEAFRMCELWLKAWRNGHASVGIVIAEVDAELAILHLRRQRAQEERVKLASPVLAALAAADARAR